MGKLPFMKMFWPDFFTDPGVEAMSPEAQGIYLLLLGRMWMNGGWLPADDRVIARRLGLDVRVWRTRYKNEMSALLSDFQGPLGNACITQNRLMLEWSKAEELRKQRIANLGISEDDYAAKSNRRTNRPAKENPRRSGARTETPNREPEREPKPEPHPRLIAHSSDKEAAGAAANHQASEPVAVSSPALRSSREEAENAEPEPAPDIRRDRDDQGTLPDAKRAADVHASTGGLLGKLEAHRRAKEGKGR